MTATQPKPQVSSGGGGIHQPPHPKTFAWKPPEEPPCPVCGPGFILVEHRGTWTCPHCGYRQLSSD